MWTDTSQNLPKQVNGVYMGIVPYQHLVWWRFLGVKLILLFSIHVFSGAEEIEQDRDPT